MKKSRFCFLGSILGVWILVLMAKHQTETGEYMGDIAAWVMISLMILLPAGFIFRSKEKRQSLSAEERAEKERKQLELQEKLERLKADSTIVATAIVNSTTVGKQKASITSSLVRGAVGSMINPAVGIVGALTPKKKIVTKGGTVTFSILYASGKRSVETVKVGSARYNELAKYIA